MIIPLTISVIVISVVFCFNYLPLYFRRNWRRKGMAFTFLISAYLVVASVLAPMGSDRERYLADFRYAEHLPFIKDPGWVLLTKLLNKVCMGDEMLYLFVLVIFYVFAYCYLGRCKLGRQHVAYYLLLSAACLGFWSGSTNIMRAGCATCLFFLSLCEEEHRKWAYIALSVVCVFIHNSVLILVASFFLTRYYRNYKAFVLLWLVFLALSAANALGPIVSFLSSHTGEVGDRIAEYAYGDDESSNALYRHAGFRMDFIVYSSLAVIYSWWIIYKKHYRDAFFQRISCTYIIVNCMWLTMIRVNYADRFALLSWSLISLIILYPYMNPVRRLPFSSKVVTVAFIPMLVNLAITLRDLFS